MPGKKQITLRWSGHTLIWHSASKDSLWISSSHLPFQTCTVLNNLSVKTAQSSPPLVCHNMRMSWMAMFHLFCHNKTISKIVSYWQTKLKVWNWLLFRFLNLVDLFSQFVDGILLFLAHRCRLRLALSLRLLQLTSQLLQLSFTLLVHVDLHEQQHPLSSSSTPTNWHENTKHCFHFVVRTVCDSGSTFRLRIFMHYFRETTCSRIVG